MLWGVSGTSWEQIHSVFHDTPVGKHKLIRWMLNCTHSLKKTRPKTKKEANLRASGVERIKGCACLPSKIGLTSSVLRHEGIVQARFAYLNYCWVPAPRWDILPAAEVLSNSWYCKTRQLGWALAPSEARKSTETGSAGISAAPECKGTLGSPICEISVLYFSLN